MRKTITSNVMGVLFKAGCKPVMVSPASPKGYTHEEVTRCVGGRVEKHEIADGCRTIFVNKFANYLGLSVNTKATEFVREIGGYLQEGEYIAGDALVLRNDEINF